MIRYALPLLLLSSPVVLAQDAGLQITKTPTTLKFLDGGQLFAEYVYAGMVQVERGDGQKPLAKPYFYPLLAPNGAPVTRGWPIVRNQPGDTTDHYHQKSVWFCHGDVIPEGLPLKVRSADKRVVGVDYWSEGAGHGRIVCTQVAEPKVLSPNHVSIETHNNWQTADGVTILKEIRTLHVHKLPQGKLITFDIVLKAQDYPITFGDTKEGSMGVRVHDAIRSQQKGTPGVLTNSLGKKSEREIWGYEADWNDYYGMVSGKPIGVSIFDHPQNVYRSAWHSRGYGLMAANPFGRKAAGFPSRKENTDLVKLPKGETLKLKYGVYAHNGDTATGQVAEAYQTFIK